MSALRKVIRAQLQNIPALALRNNVAKQIDAGGHLLPPAMVQAITEYILAGAKGEFTWIDPETGISPREPAVLNLRFNDNDLKEITASVERALDAFPDLMMKTVKQFGTKIAGDLRRRWPAERCIQDFEIGEFRDRLEVRWGKAFELYRILLTCCREVGRGSAGRFNRVQVKAPLPPSICPH